MLFAKKHLLIVIILLVPLFVNQAKAQEKSYLKLIQTGGVIQEMNSKYNIEKSKSLQGYVNALRSEAQGYIDEYHIKNEQLNASIFELRIMSESLTKIQTLLVEKSIANTIIEDIIENLKYIKSTVRDELKQELSKSKRELAIQLESYSLKAEKVSKRFIRFINTFTPKVQKLQTSEKKKLILQSLVEINREASKLAILESREFQSQKQLQDYYSNSIRSIRRELLIIQTIIIKM